MNLYQALALGVDIIHFFVIIIWVGGFFVSASRYPKFRRFHSISGMVTFTAQLVFSFRCPLVLLSGFLRELGNPAMRAEGWLYDPFIVRVLKSTFGFSIPAIAITIASVVGTVLMVTTLLHVKTEKTA